MDRRSFLRNLGLVAGAGTVSMALGNIPIRAFSRSFLNIQAVNGKVIVLLQLSGGNDGLNTIIPMEDSLYYNARPSLGIRKEDVIKLNNLTGMHPSLQPLKAMYDDGMVAIMQNVGYASPDRSHFRATDIWLSASDSNVVIDDGWVGRYLAKVLPDHNPINPEHPMAIQIGSTQSALLECTCQGTMGISFESPNQFYQLINGSTADNDPPPDTIAGNQLKYIKEIAALSIRYAQIIKEKADAVENKATYPNTRLARQLAIVAELIAGGLETPVYLTSIGGFDTHANQAGGHANLLTTVAQAIEAFQTDLKLLGIEKRVVLMTFSEFGRRVNQNGSGGTDHGTAAPLFIIGRNVFGGVYGNNPDLADLDNNGDIKFKYDFRQLYATLLTQQLGMPIERMPEVLMRDFDTLPLISEKAGNLSGPSVFHLEQNYPNPFNPATTISYYLRIPQAVRLDIFSSAGDKVATLVNAYQETGNYEVQFDGRSYSSGVYFARLDTGGTSKTIKMMMIK
ncbi:MAG: DUF1501 domain-containing protein [Ignavibacteriota bacterium]|jgi:uncharacterized protein (DUF1501 family)|nr:MAG: DUF1501 domain-containing protein [Chlorobiota bacterium]MBE7476076.1 DUF1501 domain-containing protein [Ignavibacteriales bacterium]MBL1124067.1 DUF1501 domain-containing protein [Ignavibacteriota bacterium]MCC7094459.1 DUF1501 domain-containing protein [Ignavibacteriaceae bacterium]MCE7856661.1 DUF1501 domain-containing protein [Ignavibacteria bacterium CHB3]